MSSVILTLGGVPFQDFEVPERIAFGGTQRVAVQRLIGGGRVVNVLGGDDGEIRFAGIFSGDDAASRAQAVDGTRASGVTTPLIWGEFFYSVIVAEFAADYTKPWWIPFSVRCVVVNDSAFDLPLAAASAVLLVGSDIAAATALSGQAGISLSGLAVPSSAGLQAAELSVSTGIAAAGVALQGGADTLGQAADASAGVAGLNQITASSGVLAALCGMSGYIDRAGVNFAGEAV